MVDFSIVNSAEDMQLQASNLTWPMGGATGAWELGTRALCCWKNNEEVNLNIVEDTRYGLVTSALHQESCFNYHFVENDNIVKVRAEHLTWNIEMQKTTQARSLKLLSPRWSVPSNVDNDCCLYWRSSTSL